MTEKLKISDRIHGLFVASLCGTGAYTAVRTVFDSAAQHHPDLPAIIGVAGAVYAGWEAYNSSSRGSAALREDQNKPEGPCRK